MKNSDPTASDGPPNEVFYEARRTFRNPKTILLLLIGTLGACGFWWAVLHPAPGREAVGTNMAKFFAVIYTFIVAAGAKRALAGETRSAVISTAGVRYGNDSWPWSQVRQIGLTRTSFSENRAVHIVLASGGRTIILMADQQLTPDQSEALLAKLRSWLKQHHPEVTVN